MEPMTFEDVGVKFKFFEYKDLPARQMAPNELPEVYRPTTGWQTMYDSFEFLHHAMPIDEARLNEMVANLNRQGPPAA